VVGEIISQDEFEHRLMMNNKTSHQYIMELKHGTYLDASRKGKKIYPLFSGVIQMNCVILSIYKNVYMYVFMVV
jgi:hypothetical protein